MRDDQPHVVADRQTRRQTRSADEPPGPPGPAGAREYHVYTMRILFPKLEVLKNV